MGYYWDWMAKRWHPIDHHRKLTREQWHQINRREALIEDLITELEEGSDSVIKLYAGLLAGALCQSDQVLMDRCGEKIAAIGGDELALANLEIRRRGQTERRSSRAA